MRDVTVLKERVERAERQLRASHAARERECEALMETWERIRQRYQAQEAEIARFRNRAETLQRANDELSTLLDGLLASVSANLHEATSEAVPHITERAGSLLSSEPPAPPIEAEDAEAAGEAQPAEDEPLVLNTVAAEGAPGAAAAPAAPGRESSGVRNLLSRIESARARKGAQSAKATADDDDAEALAQLRGEIDGLRARMAVNG